MQSHCVLPPNSAAAHSSKESSLLYAEFAKAQYADGIEFLNEHVEDLQRSFHGSRIDDTFYILDFGCGSCPFFERFVTLPFAKIVVVGVDPDKNRLELAREKFPAHVESGTLRLVHANDETLSEALKNEQGQPYQFNLIFSNYVLMWIENKGRCLSTLIDMLAEGGILLYQAVEALDSQSFIRFLMNEMKPKTGIATQSDIEQMRQRTLGAMHFLTCAEVLDRLAKFRKSEDYKVLKAINGDFVYQFASLDDLLTWWRATSHGNFDPSLIPERDMERLRAKFTSEINMEYLRHRVMICKSGNRSIAS